MRRKKGAAGITRQSVCQWIVNWLPLVLEYPILNLNVTLLSTKDAKSCPEDDHWHSVTKKEHLTPLCTKHPTMQSKKCSQSKNRGVTYLCHSFGSYFWGETPILLIHFLNLAHISRHTCSNFALSDKKHHHETTEPTTPNSCGFIYTPTHTHTHTEESAFHYISLVQIYVSLYLFFVMWVKNFFVSTRKNTIISFFLFVWKKKTWKNIIFLIPHSNTKFLYSGNVKRVINWQVCVKSRSGAALDYHTQKKLYFVGGVFLGKINGFLR